MVRYRGATLASAPGFGVSLGTFPAHTSIFGMMPLHFREERTTQAAARFLKLRGGQMSYMKLLKLLYLADRKALLDLGRPITYDRYVSMKHGPVLSQTYDLMVAEEEPTTQSYWRRFISGPRGYEVALLQDAPNSDLSPAQEQVIDAVFEEFGRLGRWDLVHLTHQLPEWVDPQGSSVPILISDVLRGAGLEAEEIEAVEDDLAGDDLLAQLAG
ncbi:MAG: Panacea domain-containing protein [Gemmatimonadaceae bacterium]